MNSHIASLRRISAQVWVSGQVDPDGLSELALAGFSCLVNHRPDDEEWDQPTGAAIAEAGAALGITVVHVPVRGVPAPSQVAATREALDALRPGDKALLFCRSGMRSAAAWAMAERLVGKDPEELRDAAAAAGYDLSRLPL